MKGTRGLAHDTARYPDQVGVGRVDDLDVEADEFVS